MTAQCIKSKFTLQAKLVQELTVLGSCDHRCGKRTCSVCIDFVANEQRSV